jgi:hypothetical protein
MLTFFAGMVAGIAVPIVSVIIVGAYVFRRVSNPQRVDNAADEHTKHLGIGATHFGAAK